MSWESYPKETPNSKEIPNNGITDAQKILFGDNLPTIYNAKIICKKIEKNKQTNEKLTQFFAPINEYCKDMNPNEKAKFILYFTNLSRNNKNIKLDFVIENYENNNFISDIIYNWIDNQNDKETTKKIYDCIDAWNNLLELNLWWENNPLYIEDILNNRSKEDRENRYFSIRQRYRDRIKVLTNEKLEEGLTADELVDNLDNEGNKEILETYSQYRKFKDRYWEKYWDISQRGGKWEKWEKKKFENLRIEEKKEDFKETLRSLAYNISGPSQEDYEEEIDEITNTWIQATIDNAQNKRNKNKNNRIIWKNSINNITNKLQDSIKIANDNNIWQELAEKNFNPETKEISATDPRVLVRARRFCCRDYKKNPDKAPWLWWLQNLPYDFIKELYEETNNFSNFNGEWPKIQEFKRYFWEDKSSFSEACSRLSRWFSKYLEEAQKKVSKIHNIINRDKEIIRNNVAIGSIINGINTIFTDLWQKNNFDNKIHNLELDKDTPVKLENGGEWLIINWKFKWDLVKIKYDLTTWEVFMNSCISQIMPYTITYWREDPEFYVWSILDFEGILSIYKDNPDKTKNPWTYNPEMIRSEQENQIKLIEESFEIWTKKIKDTIWKELEKNQAKNKASSDFLKTIWIIKPLSDNYNPNWEIKYIDNGPINFEEWSDAYKVMQIINNSEIDDIENFSNKMRILSRFAGRDRWNNKFTLNEDYIKFKEFPVWYYYNNLQNDVKDGNARTPTEQQLKENELKNYDNIGYFIGKLNEIWANDFIYEWEEWNISKNYKNPFASIIFEKFTDKTEPDWKLDKDKIEEFVESLEDDAGLIASLTPDQIHSEADEELLT